MVLNLYRCHECGTVRAEEWLENEKLATCKVCDDPAVFHKMQIKIGPEALDVNWHTTPSEPNK